MKLFKKISALHVAINKQDGTDDKYLLLLVAIASIIKIFTGDEADKKIDALIKKITLIWGLEGIFAQTEKEYSEILGKSPDHMA